MRIISGTRRGRKLCEFEGMSIRPTTDRVRESLFNLIREFIFESDVLDLFCGSGALSFEALSRGAKSATGVDIDAKSIEVINKNKELLKFGDEFLAVKAPAEQFLDREKRMFDIIFLDPPYNKGFIKPIIEKILENGTLSPEGIIVLESDSIDDHGEMAGLKILKERKYGRTYVTVYQRGDAV